jgi:hypothetical protein
MSEVIEFKTIDHIIEYDEHYKTSDFRFDRICGCGFSMYLKCPFVEGFWYQDDRIINRYYLINFPKSYQIFETALDALKCNYNEFFLHDCEGHKFELVFRNNKWNIDIV